LLFVAFLLFWDSSGGGSYPSQISHVALDVFDGIIGTLLGFLLWAEWPWSGFWFLGIALGIFLVMRGWSYVMLALALREGDVAPLTHEVLRRAIADRKRRPVVHTS
jgi:hypothetical protein